MPVRCIPIIHSLFSWGASRTDYNHSVPDQDEKLSAYHSPRKRDVPRDKSRPRLSYFDRLPVELKVEIFAQCLAPYPHLSRNEAPLSLCRVSSGWMAIVRATPRLWTRFEVKVPDFGVPDSAHDQLKAIEFWLEQSKNNLLSVRLSHTPVGRCPDHRSVHLLASLIPHAHRWKDIHLHLPSSSLQPFQHCSFGPLPALQSLTLQTHGLWRSVVPFNVHSMGIPWGQLTEITLHFDYGHLLTLDKCLGILSQCTSLIRCSMNAAYTFRTEEEPIEKLRFPMLHHFELILQMGERDVSQDVGPAELCLVSFLEQLEFPQLQSLNLRWVVESDETERHWLAGAHLRFISFLRSVAPTLESLTLAYLPFTDQEVLECLMQLHSLAHLVLSFSLADRVHDPITDVLLRACTPRADDEPSLKTLPLLKAVHLQCNGARHKATQVIDLIQSRWTSTWGHGLLRSFSIVSMNPVSAQTQQMLDQWSEEGLEVLVEQVIIR